MSESSCKCVACKDDDWRFFQVVFLPFTQCFSRIHSWSTKTIRLWILKMIYSLKFYLFSFVRVSKKRDYIVNSKYLKNNLILSSCNNRQLLQFPKVNSQINYKIQFNLIQCKRLSQINVAMVAMLVKRYLDISLDPLWASQGYNWQRKSPRDHIRKKLLTY